jgi:hypothetical protein
MKIETMSNDEFSAKARLLQYLDLFLKGKMAVGTFCGNFEPVYNLELDKTALSSIEAKAFSDLFEIVVWYSPFKEEREKIKNYVGEEEVLAAAKAAFSMLQLK